MKSTFKRGLLLVLLLTIACNASAFERKAEWAKYGRAGANGATANGVDTPTAETLSSDLDLISYSIGMSIGEDIKARGIKINPDFLAHGIKDLLSGQGTVISTEEAKQVLAQLQEQLANQQRELQAKMLLENYKTGQAFLAQNAIRDGVVVTASGLQYEVMTPGTGSTPALEDVVVVDYRGSYMDGNEFDSSYQRGEPVEFSVNGIIPGWTEALVLMKEGAKWRLFIPADLAYGVQGAPPVIEPNTTLVFEVELKEVRK